MPTELPEDWDDAGTETDSPDVDFEVDPVVIRSDEPATNDDAPSVPPDPDLDSLVVEFVDLFNARDMDALAELLAADAEADFLHESSGSGVVDGLSELIFRRPDVVTTRGDLGAVPVAAVWYLDADTGHYRLCGYFDFDLAESDAPLIGRIDLIEELPEDDLVVERPDDSERAEWEDWSVLDEG